MNKNRLKAKILEFGDTQADLAKAIGISLSNLNAKINGKIDFRQNEIGYIRDRYHLNPVEVAEIFFAEKVSELDDFKGENEE